MALNIKPTHKVITDYYQAMRHARDTQQLHEGAVATHFAQLLKHCLSQFPHLELVEQYTIKRDKRKPLRADGALVDKQTNVLVYGIWEAKDSKDNLTREIQRKFQDGYPDDNILFQSPDQIILYQHGDLVFNAIITDNPVQLINALEQFLSYKPPAYAQWEEAIVAFKDKVGELGQALVQIILNELKVSKPFKAAFDHFSNLCRATLNPNLAQAAVIEMLVQHLLTERLFRTIFNNADFINNNIIAREIEQVIRALTARSFSRLEFLRNLDRFYTAIEATASTIRDYSSKQDFLNAIYESFFQGFAVKVADTHGIVYTPQPIVDFMVQSVQEILQREFNEDLANPGVHVLDPFVGTGNFILRIMQEIAYPTPCPLPLTGEGVKTATPPPGPLPLTGEGVKTATPPPGPLPLTGEGVKNPTPCPLPLTGEGVKTATPPPDPLPLTGEGVKTATPPPCPLPLTGEGRMRVSGQSLDTKDKFRYKYATELHCNEIMLLPYYIASMNIEHAYYAYTGEYAPFRGICLVDTFELAEPKQAEFVFVPENTERVNAQKAAPIFVIIGNPPYNVGQQNENDNNKNRKYPHIDGVVAGTYAKDSKATLKNKLSDAYIKAFAWATERLQDQDKGIIAFVSNSGFLDGIATDGMRKQLSEQFNSIYVLNLGGNSRRTDDDLGNVFGIRVGVAITILVKNGTSSAANIRYARIDRDLNKTEKLEFLTTTRHFFNLNLQPIIPDAKHNWLTEGLEADFATFTPLGSKEGKADKTSSQSTIFKKYGLGVATNRDTWAYNFNSDELAANIQVCIDFYNEQVFRYSRLNPKPDIDGFVIYDDKKLSWSRDLKLDLKRGKFAELKIENIRTSLYRPFSRKFLYFNNSIIDVPGQFPSIFPISGTEQENRVICLSAVGASKEFHCLITNVIPDLHFTGDSQCFPFYTYNEDGTNRQENLIDWALQAYQTHYQDQTIDKWAIFYYIYGLLHHPGYREKYAANLKRELPRIPYAENFWAISHAGQQLADLHLDYETQPEYPLTTIVNGHVDWRVAKMRLNKDKTAIIYNPTLTLGNIPAEVFEYRLGNRSALDWIIDQYQVSTDKRSGIVNDPNRLDDERYIVRLIKQIVTVSLATMRLVTEINREKF